LGQVEEGAEADAQLDAGRPERRRLAQASGLEQPLLARGGRGHAPGPRRGAPGGWIPLASRGREQPLLARVERGQRPAQRLAGRLGERRDAARLIPRATDREALRRVAELAAEGRVVVDLG